MALKLLQTLRGPRKSNAPSLRGPRRATLTWVARRTRVARLLATLTWVARLASPPNSRGSLGKARIGRKAHWARLAPVARLPRLGPLLPAVLLLRILTQFVHLGVLEGHELRV